MSNEYDFNKVFGHMFLENEDKSEKVTADMFEPVADQMKSIFDSFVNVGFNENQAIEMTIGMIRAFSEMLK